jgi:hypothetical protein
MPVNRPGTRLVFMNTHQANAHAECHGNQFQHLL